MTKLSWQAFLTLGKEQSDKFNDDMSVGWLWQNPAEQ